MKKVLALFTLCFVLGVGLAMVNPAPVNAGWDPDPDPPCNTDCVDIVCGPGCDAPDYMHYRCYMTFVSPMGCLGPFDCRCRALGCGGACNIE
jgi:hypothetical protein